MIEPAKIRLLIVEDDDVMSALFCDALTAAGYETVPAWDGDMALKLYTQSRFDLVITDIVMPNMNGVELIMALHKADPTVAVIAVSGGGLFASEGYMKTASLLGAKATLRKPFTIASLITTVRQTLHEKAEAGKILRPAPSHQA